MNRVALLLTLVASCVFAQDGLTRGDSLRRREYQTGSTLTLFVDPTGNDTNACTQANTGACATISGAWRKLPRFVRNTVTINVDAGTYTENTALTGVQLIPQVDGGAAPSITISGPALANVTTLSTGTATGTLTAAAASTGSWSLSDSAQSWSTDELVGKHLVLTSGVASGQARLILENTGTSLTVWPLYSSGPAPGDGYAIRTVGVTINGTLRVSNVVGNEATNGLILQRLKFTSASNSVLTKSSTTLSDMVFETTGTSTIALAVTQPVFLGLSSSSYTFLNVTSATGFGFEMTGMPQRANLTGGLFAYGPITTRRLLSVAAWSLPPALAARRDSAAATSPVVEVRFLIPGFEGSITNNSFYISGGGTSADCLSYLGGPASLPTTELSNCRNGLTVGVEPTTGSFYEVPTSVTVAALSCSFLTTCVRVVRGGRANLTAVPTFSGVTNQYEVDSAVFTEAQFSSFSPVRIVGSNLSVLER